MAQLTATDMMQELTDLSEYFWAGESEIAKTFLETAHEPEDHILWLKHQCLRELRGPGLLLRPGTRTEWFINSVQSGLLEAESPEGRQEIEFGIAQLLEEFTHFRLYVDILESITGEPLRMADLQALHLESDDRLEAMRDRMRAESPKLAGMTFSFTEGGGAGIFHAGATLETHDPLLLRIKSAGKTIYNDEVGHYEHNVDTVGPEIESEAEYAAFKAMVIEVCQERLRMRSEMHGMTMSEDRIREITDGQIEPLRPHVIP